MKLSKILSKIIVENKRFQYLIDTNVKGKKPLMDFEILKVLILADPTTKVGEGEDIDSITINDLDKVKQVGKYANWIIKHFNSPKTGFEIGSPEYNDFIKKHRKYYLEDLYKVTDDLRKFDELKKYFPEDKRDINKYTPKQLYTFLENFEIPEKLKQKKSEKESKQSRSGFEHKGSEVVLETPDWTVLKIEGTGPEQKDAACYFGGFQKYGEGESRWCTSAPGYDYWKTYLSKGPLFVLFKKGDVESGKVTGLPKERYQFHFEDAQFMDRLDNQIDLVTFMNENPELKGFFKKNFAKMMVKSKDDVVDIEYPHSDSSKFVGIYGFDELFSILPKNLISFSFKNKSKEDLKLDLPSTIGEFTSLNSLQLHNCVKSIPESISKCQKLEFLALTDNPALTSLPQSILTIDSLSFVQLNKSPNVKLPKGWDEKFEENISGLYFSKELDLDK